jgi:hypothetical protein
MLCSVIFPFLKKRLILVILFAGVEPTHYILPENIKTLTPALIGLVIASSNPYSSVWF